jgi:hypothetical protein
MSQTKKKSKQKPKPSIVFFLGSGFSKATKDIAVQKDFLNEIFSGVPTENNEKPKNWKDIIIDNLDKPDEKDFVSKCDDIEFIMSYLFFKDTKRLYRNKPEADTSYKNAIENFRMALNEYLKPKNVEDRYQKLDKYLKDECNSALNNMKQLCDETKSCNPSYITTNYDLVLEGILKEYTYLLPTQAEQKKVPIIKLHGSINWLEKRIQPEGRKQFYTCGKVDIKSNPELAEYYLKQIADDNDDNKYLEYRYLKDENNKKSKFELLVFNELKEYPELKKILAEHEDLNKLEKETNKLESFPLNEYLRIRGQKKHWPKLGSTSVDEKAIFHYSDKKRKILTPITLPFYLAKDEWFSRRWGHIFRKMRTEATKRLKDANVVVFIGYGMPQADFTVLDLLMDSEISKKVIININENNSLANYGINVNYWTRKKFQHLSKLEMDKIVKIIKRSFK